MARPAESKRAIAVTEKSDLGSTIAFRALAAGEIDAYVDYSGTLWGNIAAPHRHAGPPGDAGPS